MGTKMRKIHKIFSATLGVPIGILKKAYRKLKPQHHPDKARPEQDPSVPQAADRFQEDAEARSLLSNPPRRDDYAPQQQDADVQRDSPPSSQQHRGPQNGEDESTPLRRSENRAKPSSAETDTEPTGTGTKRKKMSTRFDRLLDNFFKFTPQKSHQTAKPQEKDLHQDLELTLDDVVKGCQKEVVIKFNEICEDCNGTGGQQTESTRRCRRCKGAGTIAMKQGDYMVKQRCPQCDGSGSERFGHCVTCAGEGKIERQHKITIDLPPGIHEGTKLKVPKEGNPGLKGGKKGDLYLTVKLTPHPYFVRKDDDLYCQVEIDFVQAILGTTIKVPTLNGPVGLKVPAGVQPNQLLRIRGKGVPKHGDEGVGDVYVKLGVSLPTEITPRQREKLRQFYLDAGA
jgi:molecular chaperone DnaJ